MKYEFSKKLKELPPYLFAGLEETVRKKRAQGIDMIDFGIGDPDLPTPPHIVGVLQEAVADPGNQG